MGEKFYKVLLEDCDEEYYFHDHEDAAAFLIESFCDDFFDLDESQLAEANEEVAENDAISDYGIIYTLYFDK